jgi:hypothetical protein
MLYTPCLLMIKIYKVFFLLVLVVFYSCSRKKNDVNSDIHTIPNKPTCKIIVDCNYSFAEAIAGSRAPDSVLRQLKLIYVHYYSIDGRIHAGQILTNKRIASTVQQIFDFMLHEKFPIAHAIPIVKYHWNDNISMQANNTYSFCYRNVSYSKHAIGMAIDINPYFNPVIWKKGYEYRLNKPIGAYYDVSRPGTFFASSSVVMMFEEYGMRWGHNFTRNYDNHHFEK